LPFLKEAVMRALIALAIVSVLLTSSHVMAQTTASKTPEQLEAAYEAHKRG
jgi:hypothetical protein